ncbi:hypothetical protein AGMMS49928_07040 [Spirochaetia bacterium]|nr:hypothetical protein AGMMS49928_07040 [Spirochaetia bacterium]
MKISAFKYIGLVLAALAVLTTCESPFSAGLGPRVDITAPQVEIVSPAPGSFIKNTVLFRVRATDDIAVTRVGIAYEVRKGVTATQWFPLSPSVTEENIWEISMDTTNFPDTGAGQDPFQIRLRASDNGSHTTDSEDLPYYIHNKSLNVSISSVRPNISRYQDYTPGVTPTPKQYTGHDFTAMVSDTHGIARDYPKIKFWKTGEPEPAWSDPDTPDYSPPGPWKDVTPGSSTIGTQNLEFRYFMFARNSSGVVIPPGEALPTGIYQYRIWVKDVDGGELYFPSLSDQPALVSLDSAGSTTTVSIAEPDSTKLNYVKEQVIKVDTWGSNGIKEMWISVKDPATGLPRYLAWDDYTPGQNMDLYAASYKLPGFFNDTTKPLGDTGFSSKLTVKIGGAGLREINGPSHASPGVLTGGPNIIFNDETQYSFSIEAKNNEDVPDTKNLQLYLDALPPRVSNIQVKSLNISETPSPWDYVPSSAPGLPDSTPREALQTAYSTPLASSPTDYVNGTVNVTLTILDNSGSPDRKYIIRPASSPIPTTNWGSPSINLASAAAQTDLAGLWSSATTFSKTASSFPLISTGRPSGSYYLYILAKDEAGNYSINTDSPASIGFPFNINQRTDYPVFSFSSIDRSVRTAADLVDTTGGVIKPSANVMTNVEIRVKLEDDDGVEKNDVHFYVNKDGGTTWYPVSLTNLLSSYGTSAASMNFTVRESDISTAMSIPAPLPDGEYCFKLSLKDTNGLETQSGNIFFAKSSLIPVISDVQINGNPRGDFIPKSTGGPVTFAGNINAASGIPNLYSFRITVTDVTGPLGSQEFLKTKPSVVDWVSGAGENGTFSVPVTTTNLLQNDGRRRIAIEATDAYGRSSQFMPFEVTVDGGRPRIVIPTLANYLTTGSSITGTVKDYLKDDSVSGTYDAPSGVGHILYWIGAQGSTPTYPSGAYPGTLNPPPAYTTATAGSYTGAGWQDIANSESLNAILTGAIGEGRKVIYVLAFDKVGNIAVHTGTPGAAGADYSDPAPTGPYTSYVQRDFIIDNVRPEITGLKPVPQGTNPTPTVVGGIYYFNSLTTQAPKIEGMINDAGGITKIVIQRRKQNQTTGDWPTWGTGASPADAIYTSPSFATNPNAFNLSTASSPAIDLLSGYNFSDMSGPTYIADGTYEYRITATDITTYSTTAAFTMVLDRQAPVIATINPTPGGSVSTTSLAMQGTARDPGDISAISKIFYLIDDSITATDTATGDAMPAGWDSITPSPTWFKNASVPGTQGSKYFHVIAVDAAGNRSAVQNTHFIYDTQVPTFAWASTASLSPNYNTTDWTSGAPAPAIVYAGNGAFSFTFTGTDNVGMNNTTYPVSINRKVSGSPIVTPITPTVTGSPGTVVTYKVDEPAIGSLPQGDYTYTINLFDAAGNRSADITLRVIRDATPPAVTITQPAGTNVDNPGPTFSGTAVDTFSEVTHLWYIVQDRTAAPASPTVASPGTWLPITAGTNWFKSLTTTSGSGGTSEPLTVQGPRRLYVVARDAANNYSTPVPKDFVVDFGPPSIAWVGSTGLEKTPLSPSGGLAPSTLLTPTPVVYVNRSVTTGFDFTLRISDGYKLATTTPANRFKITRSLNGAAPVNLASSSYAATPNGATADIDYNYKVTQTFGSDVTIDGEYTYVITVEDESGNTATANLRVMVDRTVPDLDITRFTRLVDALGWDGTSRPNNVNGMVQFVISADDDNGIEDIKYWIRPSSMTAPTGYADTAPGGVIISTRPYTVNWDTLSGPADRTEHKIYIFARDKAGNEGGLIPVTPVATPYSTVYVDQSTDNPVLSDVTPSASSFVKSTTFTVAGKITDDDGVDTTAGRVRVRYRNDPIDAASWSAWTNATVTGSGFQVTFSGSATLGAGFTDDGAKAIEIEAYDQPSDKLTGDTSGAKRAAKEIVFRLDATAPLIAVTSHPSSPAPSFNSAQTLTGTLKELNMSSFSYSLNGGTAAPLSYTPAPSAPDYTWSLDLTSLWGSTNQGPNTLTFEAEDQVGNRRTYQWMFYVDTNAPAINFINIDPVRITRTVVNAGGTPYDDLRKLVTTLSEAEPVLRGTFTDDYSPLGSGAGPSYQWEYRIYTKNQMPDPAIPGATGGSTRPWQSVSFTPAADSKTMAWSIPIPKDDNTDKFYDGLYFVDIRISDRGGNAYNTAGNGDHPAPGNADKLGIRTSYAFMVDRKEPEISNLPLDAGTPGNAVYGVTSLNPAISITADIRDVTLKQYSWRINNGSEHWTTPTTFPPFTETTVVGQWGSGLGNWGDQITYRQAAGVSIGVPLSDYNALSSGTHTLTITARDEGGRTTEHEWKFIKDIDAPTLRWLNADATLNYTTTPGGTPFTDTAARLQGIVEDNVGVGSIEWMLQKFDYNNPATWQTSGDGSPTDPGLYNTWRPLTTGGGSPTKTFELSLTGTTRDLNNGILQLPEGRYRIALRTADSGTNTSINNKPATGPGAFNMGTTTVTTDGLVFTIDTTPPVLTILGRGQKYQNFASNNYTETADPSYSPSFSNLKDSAGNNLGYKLTGTATDGNGVLNVKVSISDVTGGPWTATLQQVNYTDLKWDATVPYLGTLVDGTVYTVNVEATDNGGRVRSFTRDFTYDITPPSIEIIDPQLGDPLNGAKVIRGASADNNSVSNVEFQIGLGAGGSNAWLPTGLGTGTPVSTGDYTWAGGLYSWTVTFDNISNTGLYANPANGQEVDVTRNAAGDVTAINLSSGSPSSNIWKVPFRVRITDIAGNTRINDFAAVVPGNAAGTANSRTDGKFNYLILDPDGDTPRVNITNPIPAAIVGGSIRVDGVAEDDDWIYAVLVRTYRDVNGPAGIVNYPVDAGDTTRLTNSEGWALATLANKGRVVNWSYHLNLFGELNTMGSQTDVWIEVMPIDSKAFETFTDPLLVTSLAPNSYQYLRGPSRTISVKVDSTVPSYDNMKVKRTNDEVNYATGIRAAGTFDIKTDIFDDGAVNHIRWKSEGITPGSSFVDMVMDGASHPLGQASYKVAMPPDLTTAGSFQIGRKYLIETVGSTNFTAIGAPSNTVGMTFVATGAGSGTGKAYAAESENPATPTVPGNPLAQKFKYHVEVTIDSTTRFPMTGTAINPSSGIFMLELEAEDDTTPNPYRAQTTFSIQVDNYYPTAEYRAPKNASTAKYWVEGRAIDTNPPEYSGPIEGVDRVLVYFRQGGVWKTPPIPSGKPNSAGTYAGPQTLTMTTASNIKEMAPGFPNYGTIVAAYYDYPQINTSTAGQNGAAVINTNEISVDNDNDGYIERFSDGAGGYKNWGFEFDTTGFSDGPLEVHYIVIDDAGNATHYKNDLYVRNNPPVISKITLRTDYNFDHQASYPGMATYDFPAEYRSYSPANPVDYMTTGFKARNYRLSFDIEVLPGKGNGALTARVQPVKKDAVVNSTALVDGTIYTIITVGDTDWTLLGARANLPNETFVATGPATGTSGTAQRYAPYLSPGSSPPVKQIAVTSNPARIDFGDRSDWTPGNDGDTEFGQSGNRIPDSTADNGSLYIVKVYDSTVTGGGATEVDQLSDVILVGLTLNNIDTTAPAAVVNTFHWNGAGDNSLYLNSRNNGHIELEADLPTSKFNGSGIMDRDPKVSGQISIRGTLRDNNLINNIWFTMDGHPFANSGAPDTTFTGHYKAAEFDPGTGVNRLVPIDKWSTDDGWKMTLSNEVINEDGHSVDWRLDLDTNKRLVANLVKADQAFRIRVRDTFVNNSPDPGTAQTTAAAKTAYYRMDVVPYISGIETSVRTEGGLKTNNIRSADGKYSVIAGTNADFITVKGFNLNPKANGVRLQSAAELGAYTPGTISGGTTLAFSSVAADKRSFKVTNNSAKSGYLTVFSGDGATTIGTLNNINNNDSLGAWTLQLSGSGSAYQLIPDTSNGSDEENMPNREADRYTTKNITLNDDRYLQFFKAFSTRRTATPADIGSPTYPDMIMAGDNPVFGYINTSGGPNTAVGTAAGTGAGSSYPQYATALRRGVNGGTGAELYTEYLIKTNGVYDGMGMARDASGRYLHASSIYREGGTFTLVYDRFAELFTNGEGWGSGWASGTTTNAHLAHAANNNALTLETMSYGGSLGLGRYQYPKVIANGDSTTAAGAAYYMFYFDQITGELLFRNFKIAADNALTNRMGNAGTGAQNGYAAQPQDATNSTGATNARNYNTSYTNQLEYNGAWSTAGGATADNNANAVGGRHRAAAGASQYFDFGIATGNRVVFIYYDDANGKLKLGYSNAAVDGSAPATAPAWTNSTIDFPNYIGTYVSMVVDGNSLHIAAQDAGNSVLTYIYVPNYAGNTYERVTVDQYGSLGNWTQIKLKPGTSGATAVPYISYLNLTEVGSRDALKLAYPKAPIANAAAVKAGVDGSDYTTGAWEYMTVPALTPPQGGKPEFQKVNLGFRTSDTQPVLGYLGQTAIEFAYPVNE